MCLKSITIVIKDTSLNHIFAYRSVGDLCDIFQMTLEQSGLYAHLKKQLDFLEKSSSTVVRNLLSVPMTNIVLHMMCNNLFFI